MTRASALTNPPTSITHPPPQVDAPGGPHGVGLRHYAGAVPGVDAAVWVVSSGEAAAGGAVGRCVCGAVPC